LRHGQDPVAAELGRRLDALMANPTPIKGAGGVTDGWLVLIEAHRLMVRDPLLAGRAEQHIADGADAATALHFAAHEVITRFRDHGNPLLADRATDVEQVRDRLVAVLASTAVP
ncbi:MAG: hypothetical protein L3J05_03660, partial [Robiginitomaculum sp.]|nr:hypothetical protein [Robiginitomaculum sp.]